MTAVVLGNKPGIRLLFYCFFLLNGITAKAQLCTTCWGGSVPIVRNLQFPNTYVSPNIGGYVQFLPVDYYDDPNKKFPLILSINGIGGTGNGDEANLCNIVCGPIPLHIEQGHYPDFITNNGNSYSYIIISPAYQTSANASDISQLIDYCIQHYRVDQTRIYLTGLSSGESLIMNYMSSSAQNANRIAALAVLGNCSGVNSNGARNIGTQGIHYWAIQCATDDRCSANNSVNWTNAINSYSPSGNPMAKYTWIYQYANSQCGHDIFYGTYDYSWKENGKAILDWFFQYSKSSVSSSLPALLAGYSVSLDQGKALVNWSTSAESGTAYFAVERSADGVDYRELGRVDAAGVSGSLRNYRFTDSDPLYGISFYRLVEIDVDGSQKRFEVKKLINLGGGSHAEIMPVPVRESFRLLLTLEESQVLQFSIADLNGRIVKSWNGYYTAGSSQFTLSSAALMPGTYFLKIEGTRFSETKRFIKQ